MKTLVFDAVGRVRGETDAWRITPWWWLPAGLAERFQANADRHRTDVLALSIYAEIMASGGDGS